MIRPIVSGIVAVLLVSILMVGCTPQPPTPTPTPTPTPGMEKNFTLPRIDNGSLTLGDYLGQPIIVNFFLDRCPACVLEVPHLNTVYQRYRESHGLLVAGVGVGSLEEIRQFAEQHGAEYPVVYDQAGQVADLYGVRPVPHTVFINRQGRLQGDPAIGLMSETQLERRLQDIL